MNKYEKRVDALLKEFAHDPEAAHIQEDRWLSEYVHAWAAGKKPSVEETFALKRLVDTGRSKWYA